MTAHTVVIKVGEVAKTTQVLKCDHRWCYVYLHVDLILKRIPESFENPVTHDMKKKHAFLFANLNF